MSIVSFWNSAPTRTRIGLLFLKGKSREPMALFWSLPFVFSRQNVIQDFLILVITEHPAGKQPSTALQAQRQGRCWAAASQTRRGLPDLKYGRFCLDLLAGVVKGVFQSFFFFFFWRKLAYGKYRSSAYRLINSTRELAWRHGHVGGDKELGQNPGLGNLVVKKKKKPPQFLVESKVHLQQDHMTK